MMRRLKRRWLALLALVIALLIAVFSLLFFSSFGSQLVWHRLQSMVPGLEGKWSSGVLANGWELHDTKWQNEYVTISIKHAQIKLKLLSLLTGKLDVDALMVDGLSVTRREVNASTALPDVQPAVIQTANEYISTPIPIVVHQLTLSDFTYDDPVVQVRVKSLLTGANWRAHHIEINPSQSAFVDVWLKPNQSKKLPTTKQVTQKATPALPDVFVPFDINLAQLDLKQGRYHQQGFDTGLMDIRLQARFDGTALTVEKAEVNQPTRRAELSGRMTFIQNYLLDAKLITKTALPFISPETNRAITLTAKGDLQQLMFNANLDGKENVQLQGKLKPLTADIPFELSGDWQQLPLPTLLVGLTVAKGKIDLRGSLHQYQLTLESNAKWLNLPSTRLQVALRGSADKLDLQQLQLGDGANQLVVAGQLNWQNGLHWQGQSNVALPEINRWVVGTKASVSGGLKQEVQWQDGRWRGQLSNIDLKGQWNGFPLSVSGALHGDEQGQWQFQQIAIQNGPNTFTLDGKLDKQWSLVGKLRAQKLSAINAQWDGGVDGDFRLIGSTKAPALAFRVAAPRLVLQGQLIRELEVTGHATLDDKLPGQFQLHANRWNVNGTRLQNVSLSLNGNAQQHQLKFTAEGKQLNGLLLLTGGWRKNTWQGQLQEGVLGGLAGEWRAASSVALLWKNRTLSFKSHCWQSSPSQLCFADSMVSSALGKIPFTLSNLNTQRLKPWLPEALNWPSILQANGILGWRGNSPDLSISLRSQHGEFVTDDIHTPYRDISLQLDVTPKSAQMAFLLDSDMLGNINVNAQVFDPLKRRQLSGTVNLTKLQLYGVAPLVDALHSTKGRVDINGRLAGTLDAPLFYGRAELKEGEVDTETEMLSLRQINGTLVIEGDQAALNATLRAGKGTVDLTGHSQWPAGILSGELALHSKEMALAFAGYGNGRIDSDLQLQFDAEQASLSGNVVVPWARIEIKSLPDNGIALSDDVHVVRPLQQQSQRAPFPFFMDVDLRLGSDIQFSAMGLKTALGGGLRFRQKPSQNLMTQGEIRLVNGRFKAYGQNLVIRSGKLMFNGDVTEPYVMAEAIRDPASMEDTSVTVGVKINAPINSISAQVFSEPELPDTDKLSYLLRGRSSTATTNGSTEESMAAMMIGAGLGQTNGVVSDVASTFGLKDAAFDTSGSGTDTKVNLSAYLLKDLQLQYGVGVYSAVSEVKLKYFLLPQLYLQAVSNLEQAVDLFYKFEF